MRSLISKLKGFLPQIEISFSSIVVNVVSLIGIIILSINIVSVIRLGLERYNLIKDEANKLASLQSEESNLRADLKWYSSLAFAESQSRDYLNLANEGDSVLVVPDNVLSAVSENSNTPDVEGSLRPDFRNWLNLLDIF